ncbi:hypothetical protein [Streptomyces vinaceus]|uniref:hypothetical protein n=1 Tax=Streptomyces vinaceus TaxID=1960 RepID=UPI0036C7A3B0
MRYLAEAFVLGALRRGRPVEQFLGPIHAAERLGVRYVEVRPQAGRYEIFLHTVEDVGHENFLDLAEFPPLDQDSEEEDFGRLATAAPDPLAALEAAENGTGAVRQRWVNATMAQDEYADFVRAGRPRHSSPDGTPGQRLKASPDNDGD